MSVVQPGYKVNLGKRADLKKPYDRVSVLECQRRLLDY